jgi:hypothetical protein
MPGERRAVFLVTVMALTACTKPTAASSSSTREQAAPSAAPEVAEPPAAEAPASEPATPEPSPAAPPEPEPPADPAALAKAAAGEGFRPGPRPKLIPHENASEESAVASLSHAGVTVRASAHAEPGAEEFEYTTALQIRVEFDVLPGEDLGLNRVAGGGDDYCDELVPFVQEIAKLDDGRWLVDAQLACRAGEDEFSARNEHNLLLIEPARPHAELLWTGEDSGESAMGVCVSSSVTSYELVDEALVIRKTEVTSLDQELAKELPAGAEGCKPEPERTTLLTRIDLALGREL